MAEQMTVQDLLARLGDAASVSQRAAELCDCVVLVGESAQQAATLITAEIASLAQARKELAEAGDSFDVLSRQYLTQAHAAEIALASAMDLCNTYARENGLHEATSLAGLKHVIGSLGMRLNALRAERDALDEEARRYKGEVDARREAEDEWLATRADLGDRAQKAETEVATLRAAIGTPEVYAGVVTEVVEAELEQCRKELAEERDRADVLGMEIVILNAERDALKGADDGNGCPWKPMFYEERAKRVAAEASRNRIVCELDDLQCALASSFGWEMQGKTFQQAVHELKAEVERLTKHLADAEAHAADFGMDCERLRKEVERLAAVRAWATSERPPMPQGHATSQDDRWCSHCDSLIDGVGHAQATVLRILDGDANL